MRNRIGIVVLVLLCLGLGIALITTNRDASRRQSEDAERIVTFSNKVETTKSQYEEQKQVATLLEKDVETQKKNVADLNAKVTDASQTLSKTEASLEAAKKELAERDSKIAELETQNQALDKQALSLTNQISTLTAQITNTQKKLAASEGDRAYLEKELTRLIGERAELERQFNDITVLKAQVAKLKEEMNIARRQEWARNGLYASSEQKGAQRLMQGIAPVQTTAQTKAARPNYDLNVEVTSDGSVRVIPPITNSGSTTPAAK
jgi:chromosome segregation ATPase